MLKEDVIHKFKETRALLEGHFLLSSGLHSALYLQCALALQATADAQYFGGALAAQFRNSRIDTVVSPAIGGIVIGYEVARQLDARFIWTERQGGTMTLRRGFELRPRERILIVEDVVTTGGSTRDTIAALRETGAEVIAAAAIIDRSGGKADVGVPLFSLAQINVPAVASDQCESCKRGVPLIKPGSRVNN